jgi:hypothetical protein
MAILKGRRWPRRPQRAKSAISPTVNRPNTGYELQEVYSTNLRLQLTQSVGNCIALFHRALCLKSGASPGRSAHSVSGIERERR